MAYGCTTDEKNIMSDRAYEAIQDGKLPAKMMAKMLKEKGLFKGVTAKDIENSVCSCEWHHMNKNFKEVNFFFIGDVFDYRRELRRAIKERKQLGKLKSFFRKDFGYVPQPKNHAEKWMDLDMLCSQHISIFKYLLK